MSAKDRLKELLTIAQAPTLPAYKQLKEALEEEKGSPQRIDKLKKFFGIKQDGVTPDPKHISGGWKEGDNVTKWPDDQKVLVNAPGGEQEAMPASVWWP